MPSPESITKLPPLLHSILEQKNNLLLDTYYLLLTRAIRAFTPWPGIYTEVSIKGNKKRLKLLSISLSPDTSTLTPISVQLEGKQPVSWDQFISGYPEVLKS